ncbi:hypothetical protein, partial [Vibrio alfacsensis]|uniref:hypothetical protein n=1 Tax=Vibrio alfacsensis TaxID=1074311 RepID=UPI004067CBBE
FVKAQKQSIDLLIETAKTRLDSAQRVNDSAIKAALSPTLTRDVLAVYGLSLTQMNKEKVMEAMSHDKNVLAALKQMPSVLSGIDEGLLISAEQAYLANNHEALLKEQAELASESKIIRESGAATAYLLSEVEKEFTPTDAHTIATGE